MKQRKRCQPRCVNIEAGGGKTNVISSRETLPLWERG
jgi:hypothetical protein